jgi:SNF2 family DNA or RNA helicase
VAVIVSKAHRKLLVPATAGARSLFPGAQELAHNGQTYLVADHSLGNVVLTKHLGFDAPNPMTCYYSWHGGKPFKVQQATCSMLTENPRAYVLNHMGTGKTKSALWAWDYLYEQGLVGKALIVAPLSTLHFVWAKEAFMTLPHRKVAVLHGAKAKRLQRLQEDADIYVINHDGVKVIHEELKNRTDINVLILDELAVYRNNSDRSKGMRDLANRFSTVWGLTGAPMPNAPTDVWSQCRIVTPNTVPKYFRHAQDMLMTKVTQFKYVPKPEAVETAFRFMQPSVRFSLDDVVELPDIIHQMIDVDLSPEQKTLYEKVAKELQVMVKEKLVTAMNAGVAMGKLLQIAGGWVYAQDKSVVRLDASPRIDKLLEIIDGNERKLLVFVPYRHALEGLSHVLSGEGGKRWWSGDPIEHCVVHGQTPNREDLFNAFQNTDKYKVLLAHPECLAHGLTLTTADTIVWYLPLASLDIYDQANARIRRVGQKHKQQILHLQGTPVEKKIYALLRGKAKVQDQLLGMFEEASEWRTAA